MAWHSNGFEGLKIKGSLRTPNTAYPGGAENLLGGGGETAFDRPEMGSPEAERGAVALPISSVFYAPPRPQGLSSRS